MNELRFVEVTEVTEDMPTKDLYFLSKRSGLLWHVTMVKTNRSNGFFIRSSGSQRFFVIPDDGTLYRKV